MDAGLRRLLAAWATFGVLLAADIATAVAWRRGSAWHGILDNSAVCAFVWSLFECFSGPRAVRRRQERVPMTATEVAEAVGAQLRAGNDKGGQRVRRCS